MVKTTITKTQAIAKHTLQALISLKARENLRSTGHAAWIGMIAVCLVVMVFEFVVALATVLFGVAGSVFAAAAVTLAAFASVAMPLFAIIVLGAFLLDAGVGGLRRLVYGHSRGFYPAY